MTLPMFRNALVAIGLCAAVSSASAEDEMLPGWTAGPPADATMEKGRRFDCAGGACPADGLSCLHARTPVPAPGARRIRQEDLTRPHAMPWTQIEFWMATRIAILKPDVAGDRQAKPGSGRFAEEPHAEAVAGKPVVLRRYGLRTETGSYAVPTAFWVDRGRMNIVLCVAGEGASKFGEDRLEDLVGALNETPPAPPPPAE